MERGGGVVRSARSGDGEGTTPHHISASFVLGWRKSRLNIKGILSSFLGFGTLLAGRYLSPWVPLPVVAYEEIPPSSWLTMTGEAGAFSPSTLSMVM